MVMSMVVMVRTFTTVVALLCHNVLYN
jgi:hypothetical protein